MLNRKLLILTLVVLLVPMLTFFAPAPAKASPPAITITPLQANTNTNVDYCYSWPSASGLAGDKSLYLFFQNNAGDGNLRFDAEQLTASEVTFYVDSPDCGVTQGGGYEARLTETASTDDNGQDQIGIFNRALSAAFLDSLYVGVSIKLDANSGGNPFSITNATNVSVKFHNVAGNSVLTPITAGNYKTLVEQVTSTNTAEWMDTQLLYIGNANQVNISSTVDPTLSLTLNSNTCGLGLLRTDALKTCDYSASVATNAVNGYSGYIKQNDGFKSGANQITDETDDSKINGTGALTATYGEYGIGVQTTDSASFLPTYATDCVTNYDGLTNDLNAKGLGDTSNHVFASYNGPVDGTTHGATTFCHGARIKFDTPPGTYTSQVTITVVGNF